MATDDDDDPKVKQILDSATQADLERWFSLPSFQQVEEEKQPSAVEADMAAVMERRNQAVATVDPKLLAAIYARADRNPAEVTVFRRTIDVHHADMGKLDEVLVANLSAVAEPRDYRRPDRVIDDLKDRAPQALLRDLHRPELYFTKEFSLVDPAAAVRVDVVAEVAAALRITWGLPPFDKPLEQARADFAEARALRARPWVEYLPQLPNRSVEE